MMSYTYANDDEQASGSCKPAKAFCSPLPREGQGEGFLLQPVRHRRLLLLAAADGFAKVVIPLQYCVKIVFGHTCFDLMIR